MASSAGGPGEVGCFALGRKSKKTVRPPVEKRRSGSELLVASEHVPDRVGDVDLGDLGAPLATVPALVSPVALRGDRMAERMNGRLERRPAQVAGPCLLRGPRRSDLPSESVEDAFERET